MSTETNIAASSADHPYGTGDPSERIGVNTPFDQDKHDYAYVTPDDSADIMRLIPSGGSPEDVVRPLTEGYKYRHIREERDVITAPRVDLSTVPEYIGVDVKKAIPRPEAAEKQQETGRLGRFMLRVFDRITGTKAPRDKAFKPHDVNPASLGPIKAHRGPAINLPEPKK